MLIYYCFEILIDIFEYDVLYHFSIFVDCGEKILMDIEIYWILLVGRHVNIIVSFVKLGFIGRDLVSLGGYV